MRLPLCCLAILSACASAPRPLDPLARLNQAARTSYAEARGRALAHAGPVIWAGTDKMVLLRAGARDEASAIPPGYHELKSVAHVALGLHGLLADGHPDPARLRELRQAIEGASPALQQFPPEQAARQREILSSALALLDGPHAPADLASWERKVAPLLLANAYDAARAQLELVDKAVRAWRAKLTEAEWSGLHVIVVGAHMAREGELKMQYFARLLGEPAEGGRLVFAEALWTEPQGLELLGTHLLDGAVGAAFFGDARRMHRDLLAEAAEKLVPELLAR